MFTRTAVSKIQDLLLSDGLLIIHHQYQAFRSFVAIVLTV